MEGPSLYLAAKQLPPFRGKTVLSVSGNTKIEKERLLQKKVKTIFSWGKHLIIQFDDFALRTHFLLFGVFEATVNDSSLTGDYRRAYTPRLQLDFENGEIKMFNCSAKFLETNNAKSSYDFTIDIMSPKWDADRAFDTVSSKPDAEIADLLLDQEILAGVGNIIKNEVLWWVGSLPSKCFGCLHIQLPRQPVTFPSDLRRVCDQFIRRNKYND